MTTIHLFEFKNYDRDSLHQYLLLQEELSFEIVMQLHNVPCPESPYLIHCQFRAASYTGQMLATHSRRFSYNVPSIYTTAIFRFRFITKDIKKLADILFLTICGCYNTGSNIDLWDEYHEGLDIYWDGEGQYGSSKATIGLTYVADKYAMIKDL